MLKRNTWMLIVFLLAGCAHHVQKAALPGAPVAKGSKVSQLPRASKVSTTQPSTPTTQYRQVKGFSQIDVQGRVNVNLHTGFQKPEVILTGDARDLVQVKVVVADETLYIALGNGFPRFGTVHADVKGHLLTRLRYVGAGMLTGNRLYTPRVDMYLSNQGTTKLAGTIGLHTLDVTGGSVQINGVSSRYLDVALHGKPKVQLTGYANLAKLDIDGNGWLSLYWVKSNMLTIHAKKAAKVQLAGAVNKLDVELWGTANFKGRYLRAARSFVKTHNKSVAEISSVNHQSTLALDASDIYYYNIPGTRADFMAYNGSVLDMREWNQHDFEDFTRYNKQFP